MASKNRSVLQSSPVVRKTFSYQHGSVSMSMTLRIDQKGELTSSVEIAERFLEDLKKELKRIDEENKFKLK